MKGTWKAHTRLLIFVAKLVSLLSVSQSSPIPGNVNPLVHSLATYATTNSFLYTNKIGSRFTKPQASQLQTYSKFIGFPQHSSFDSDTGGQLSTDSIFTNGNHDAVPLGKSIVAGTGDDKSLTVGDISTLLTPPRFPFSFFAQGANQVTDRNVAQSPDINESAEESSSRNEMKPASVSENDERENVNSGELGVIPSHDNPTDTQPAAETKENFSDHPDSSEFGRTNNDKKLLDSKSELEDLFTRVINSPVRRISVGNVNVNEFTGLSPQNRQDSSTLEQPVPFFSSATQKLSPQGIFNEQRPLSQFSPTGSGNYRFTLPSTSHQQPPVELFPGNTRFPIQNNVLSQRPTSTQTQLHSQPPSFSSPPQINPSQFSAGNNDFTQPSTQDSLNQHQINFPQPPFSPQTQFPNNGPPPPEPENGYNPFHRQENYPEPPYESEFINDPPISFEDSLEQNQQRPTGRNIPLPLPAPQLDFAQSTLRNVRTEELLDVVRRKQVPRECVYNTISYGPNGEDCVEARKK